MEVFNEIIIFIVACLMFLFTDLTKERDAKVYGAWVVIGLVLFNVLANIVVIFAGIIVQLRDKWRKKRAAALAKKKGVMYYDDEGANQSGASGGSRSGGEDSNKFNSLNLTLKAQGLGGPTTTGKDLLGDEEVKIESLEDRGGTDSD